MAQAPLNDRAAAVLAEFAGNATVQARNVLAAIVGHKPNVGARLVDRLGLESSDLPVDVTELTEVAGREALRVGGVRVGCEHLALALVDLSAGDLAKARAELQAMLGEAARRPYTELASQRLDEAVPPVAVMVTGLPGAGKSTVAETVGKTLRAPVFSVDWQLGALTPFTLVRPDNAFPLAEHLLTASMARQLQLGVDTVLDGPGDQRRIRDGWRSLTENLGGVFIGVECVCPDETVHRDRVAGRVRGIPGWPSTVSWDHVRRMRDRWENWDEPHLVLDTTRPLADSVAEVLAEVTKNRLV